MCLIISASYFNTSYYEDTSPYTITHSTLPIRPILNQVQFLSNNPWKDSFQGLRIFYYIFIFYVHLWTTTYMILEVIHVSHVARRKPLSHTNPPLSITS